MNIIQRAQDILLKPKATWPQIAAEPASVASIFQQWLLILAAIPALASFIGLSLLGVGGFGFRLPIASGLVQMVMSYLLALGMVYVMALVVDALAPTFGGRKNFLAAFKLVAYSCTAAFVGGIFNLIPSLAVLGLLAAIYSIYLLYLGLPVLMGNPDDKSPAYTAVVVVVGIVASLVIGALSAALSPGMGMGMGWAARLAALRSRCALRRAKSASTPASWSRWPNAWSKPVNRPRRRSSAAMARPPARHWAR
jgi:hypothetical protein